MQERISSDAVRAARGGKPCAVVGPAIATDHIAAGIAQVRVVDPELSMVEEIECLSAKFQHASLTDYVVLQNAEIEVGAMRIVQNVTARIPEGESTGRNEHVWIT